MPPSSTSFQFLNPPTPQTPIPPYMGAFTLRARANTDIWRTRSSSLFSAPVLYTTPLTSTFHTASVCVRPQWDGAEGGYDCDQAGLVILATPSTLAPGTVGVWGQSNFVKAGIMLSSSGTPSMFSTTSTNSPPGSDFVSTPLPAQTTEVKVKMEKVGDALWVYFDVDDGEGWRKGRDVSWFFEGVEEKMLRVGIYVSRPCTYGFGGDGEGEGGFGVEFEELEVLTWE